VLRFHASINKRCPRVGYAKRTVAGTIYKIIRMRDRTVDKRLSHVSGQSRKFNIVSENRKKFEDAETKLYPCGSVGVTIIADNTGLTLR